jgi:hypothetical protein
MRPRDGVIFLLVVLAGTTGCAMPRHRAQVREGLLTRGLHREAFVTEWGPPSRTFAVRGRDAVWRTSAFSARWERPVYEVWEYQDRATCLTFDGVRLVSWETGRSDCTPRREPELPARDKRPPSPYPPYPEGRQSR